MDKAIDNLQINAFNNRKIVITTKQGTPLRVQFPRMYMPFGVSGFTPEVGPTKYNIDFAIKGYDEEESYMKNFYDSVRKVVKSGIAKVEFVVISSTNSLERADR